MQYKLDRGSHSVYSLQYHLVQVIKYRKKALDNEKIVDLLKLKINEISTRFQVDVIDIGCDLDHFHMIFKSKPTLDIPKYLNAPSYFLATTGQVTLEQLNKYVENQGEK